MRNLLSANFLRLKKSGLFWGLLGVMFTLGAAFTLQHFTHWLKWGARFYLTIDLLTYALLLGFGMAAVICLLGMLVLYLAAGNIEIPLMHPEYLNWVVTETGETIPGEPNPRYVGGTARVVLESIQDLLPTGQSLQYMRADVAHPVRLPLYSLIDIAAFTATGAALFRRKDVK